MSAFEVNAPINPAINPATNKLLNAAHQVISDEILNHLAEYLNRSGLTTKNHTSGTKNGRNNSIILLRKLMFLNSKQK